MAVASEDDWSEGEVLFSLDLLSPRGLELVMLANQAGKEEVLRVTTRSQAKAESQLECEEDIVMALETPKVKPVQVEVESSGVSTGEGIPAADRPAGGPNPVASGDAKEQPVDFEFVLCRESEDPELSIPPVKPGGSSRQELIRQVQI